MSRGRGSTLGAALRSLSAVILAAALLFVVPYVLIRFVGWPLPTVLPAWDDITFAIRTGSIDPQTWIKGIAVVAWIAWAQIALAFVVEFVAVVRGRTAAAMKGFSGAQWVAARTVAQIALVASLLVKSSAAVAAPLPAFPVSQPVVAQEVVVQQVEEPVAPTEEDDRPSATVGRRDTLMSLAEMHLGSSDRWTEIREANVGRIMPDGTELTSSFTRLKPGWTLALPDDAVMHRVADGDNLWELAEAQLEADLGREASDAEITPYWADVVDENRPDLLPPGDPDLIYPGQDITLPSTGEAAPRLVVVGPDDRTTSDEVPGDASDALAASGLTGAVAGADVGRSTASSGDVESVSRDSGEAGPGDTGHRLLFSGAGLLAAGMLGLINRERARRLADRRRGEGLPDGDLDLERSLAEVEQSDAALALFSAVDSLSQRSVRPGEPLAQPDVIMATPDGLDVVMSGSDVLPEPWRSQGDAHLFPRDAFASPSAVRTNPASGWASPALVTVADSIVVNLESIGVLSVDGAPDATAALVRSMVHELATGPARQQLDIRCSMEVVGAALHRNVRVEHVADLAGEIHRWLDRLDLTLGAAGAASGYALRISGSERDPITPLVLFLSAAEIGQVETILHRTRTRRYPLAIVVLGRCPATATASIHPDGVLHLAPYGHEAPAQQLSVEVVERAMAAVNRVVAAPLRVPISVDPTVADRWSRIEAWHTTTNGVETTIVGEAVRGPGDEADGSAEIEVRVLGPVVIEGAKAELSDLQTSLVAYLSVVGEATSAQVQQALWPHREPSDARFQSLLADTRLVIGRGVLPERGDGKIALVGVSSDIDRARTALRRANDLQGEHRIDVLYEALDQVSGVPFAGTTGRSWRWVSDQYLGIATQASALLGDAAIEVAHHANAVGDLVASHRAVSTGRLVAPLNQELLELELADVADPVTGDRLRSQWEDAYEAAIETFAPDPDRSSDGATIDDTIDRGDELVDRV